MSDFEVGKKLYLSREIIEPACGDHPEFLLGRFGEQVEIKSIESDHPYPYSVEGPTNRGKEWRAEAKDLMRTKPFNHNC